MGSNPSRSTKTGRSTDPRTNVNGYSKGPQILPDSLPAHHRTVPKRQEHSQRDVPKKPSNDNVDHIWAEGVQWPRPRINYAEFIVKFLPVEAVPTPTLRVIF